MRSTVAFILVAAVFTVLYSGTCVSGAPQPGLGDAGNTFLGGIVGTLGGVVDVKKVISDTIISGAKGALDKGSEQLLNKPKEVQRSTEILWFDIDKRFGAI